jgi:hypothetical protein
MIALMLLGLIALLEVGGLLFGVAFSGLVDSALPDLAADADIDMDADIDGAEGAGAFSSALSWLGVGKAPLLIVLAAFLAAFGVIGVLGQNFMNGALGFFPSALIAGPLAFIAALPVTRVLAIAIGKMFPKEETDAVSRDMMIGRVAKIIRGTARKGAPAEAKVIGPKGNTHYILVEPEGDEEFAFGAEILLTEKTGPVFRGVVNTSDALRVS